MNLENKDVDGILQYADPVIAAILNKAISGKDITSREALVLFDAKGIDFQLVGRVADYLRKQKVGDTVTYVCLLYTSPSPRDRTRSRMPSSA